MTGHEIAYRNALKAAETAFIVGESWWEIISPNIVGSAVVKLTA